MKKHLAYELKDLDNEGQVSFYFSKFDIQDSDRDVILKGAFKKTKENIKRIKHFYNHNMYNVPGVLKEIGEDSKGAFAVSQLALKTQLGNDVYEQYKAGIISEHSFGYDVMKSEWNEDKTVQTIKEIKLYEVSSLTAWGANPETNVIDVKSMEYLNMLLKSNKYEEKIVTKINEVLNYLESLKAVDETLEPVDAIRYLTDNLNFIK